MPQKIKWRNLIPGDIVEEGDWWFYFADPNTTEGFERRVQTIELMMATSYCVGKRVQDDMRHFWRPIALINGRFIHSTIRKDT